MGRKAVSVLLTLLLLNVSVAVSNVTLVKGASAAQRPIFRLLAIEQMFDNHRMRSAQFLVQQLLHFPNWNNSTGVAYIHLLSLYNYSEVFDEVKPFWRGTLSEEIVRSEITDFLGTASPGEIAILYFCGHSRTSIIPRPLHSEFMGISPNELRDWLGSALSRAYVTLILDTCYSGYWRDFSPRSTILTACGNEQAAWGGDCGIFTWGLIDGLHMADESNGDGWLSAAEVFPYAKNHTETTVTWDAQTPQSYYGAVEGDLPIIQRDDTEPFPVWDIAIQSIALETGSVEPESTVIINVTVENEGEKYADFDVTLYADSGTISTQQVALLPGEAENVTFTWSPTDIYGVYTVSSVVSVCPGEPDTADNHCHGPEVVVAFMADMNLDGTIDISDLSVAARTFGSYPHHPRWNPDADINNDNLVDISDLALIARDFGQK